MSDRNNARDPRRLLRLYFQAARDINDGYKAPEIRAAADNYMSWLEEVVARGLAAETTAPPPADHSKTAPDTTNREESP